MKQREFRPTVDCLEIRVNLNGPGDEYYPAGAWAGPIEVDRPVPPDAQNVVPPVIVQPIDPKDADATKPHVVDPFEDPFADPIDHTPGIANPPDMAPGTPPDA